MRITKKGQMTIIGLILVFIMIIIVANLMPTITEQIAIGKNATGLSTSTKMFMDLIPMFIVLAIIITLFIYVVPYRPIE